VLYGLTRGPRRHGELLALVGGISKKVLTQTLRRLERHGLVRREAYPGVPPRVEYELTDLGRTLGGDWVEAVRALHPAGVDVLLTCRGGETKRRAPEVLRDRGRLVWMTGGRSGGTPDGARHRRRLRWRGSVARNPRGPRRRDDSGRLRPSVQDVYPLTEARAAQIRVAEGHVRGKLVISVGAVPYDAPRSSLDRRTRAGVTGTGS
jgi:DNA-binding transcriptional ArsR family regulator